MSAVSGTPNGLCSGDTHAPSSSGDDPLAARVAGSGEHLRRALHLADDTATWSGEEGHGVCSPSGMQPWSSSCPSLHAT
jgi:hypothetical protein